MKFIFIAALLLSFAALLIGYSTSSEITADGNKNTDGNARELISQVAEVYSRTKSFRADLVQEDCSFSSNLFVRRKTCTILTAVLRSERNADSEILWKKSKPKTVKSGKLYDWISSAEENAETIDRLIESVETEGNLKGDRNEARLNVFDVRKGTSAAEAESFAMGLLKQKIDLHAIAFPFSDGGGRGLLSAMTGGQIKGEVECPDGGRCLLIAGNLGEGYDDRLKFWIDENHAIRKFERQWYDESELSLRTIEIYKNVSLEEIK